MATKIQLRRDLSSNWASTNPILAQGEPGVELDTNNMKIGDGVKAWNDLAYTVQESGLQSVFVNVGDYYSNNPRISEDGIHWTGPNISGGPGTYHSNRWIINSVAIGNGVIVYRGYNDIENRDEIRYGTSPYQAAVTPDSDITRRGPKGEDINWNTLTFGGGYFVAGGWYHESVANTNRPIAAYSADGATWTKIDIDLSYVNSLVIAQNNAHNSTVGGMRISSVTYGTTGWLFSLDYEFDNTTRSNPATRLNPGAFYITDITTALNSSSYFATMPATSWSAYFDGHGWFAYYTSLLIYRNTNTDPRQGTWVDIEWPAALAALDNVNNVDNGPNGGDYYGVEDIAAGEVGGVDYMAISDYYGVVYYTADQGTTWNYVTPGPAYAGINHISINNVNGGIYFTGSAGNGVDWGQAPLNQWYGEKITITGSYVVELNGTWWIDHYDGNWPLYHDKGLTQRLDTSGFETYGIVEKYVSYGEKGDTHIVLPDTTNIVVGQRIFGIDAVLTLEDIKGDWKEPNLVTAVNTDTNTITLKYPLYQTFSNETLRFQAVVKYTHGDNLRNLIYGGGKFVATGDDTSRAYFTTNMTDWKYTQFAGYDNGWNNGATAYGALNINKNALRNDSEFLPGITNSLTLGDSFNVSVASITDVAQGPYDYYGAVDYGTGTLDINPSDGSWYLGTYDNARDAEVAIYSYTGYQIGPGGNVNADEYYHATSVRIETANNSFYFDDYYGTFMAEKINIGTVSDNYYDYYGYNHIDDIHFDEHDIYTSDGYELTIYNYFAPSPTGGGVKIHWDNVANVSVNGSGITLTDGGYHWQFTSDRSGVVYAPNSSEIDMTGYWTIGQGNGSAGYPYIGAVNNLDTPQSDPYDFVIQAGQSNGPTVNNYWYFNRDGNLTLPPSGNIDVDGYWLIGNDTAKIYANAIVTGGEVRDIVIRAGAEEWQFLQNAKFKLPAGGDIVNSSDQSVLNQDIPQTAVSAAGDYTLVIGDRGKHIYKTNTGSIYIPTNASVAFPIGTCITLVTGSAHSTTIVPVDTGTTTLILSKFGTDNEINIPADTYVTILKIETDKWIVQT